MYRNSNNSNHQYSNDSSSSPMMTLCTRCGFTVYPVDRIGPLKTLPSPNPTSTYYHPGCFKCLTCSTRLSLRTYYHSQHDSEDPEVYCISHVPKPGPGHLDGNSVGIRSVIQHKNGQQQVRNLSKGTSSAYQEHYHHEQKESISNDSNPQFGRFDASALHIAHALRATQLQKAYKKEKPIHYYLPPALQTALELRHRQEEDDLYNKFAMTRAEEEAKIQAEFKQEWERELEKLASKFESLRVKDPVDMTTVQKIKRKEREDLEKFMTLKKDKKEREKMRVLLEKERAATLALVEKQSQEMLHLINEKKREMRSKIRDEDEEDFDGIEEYPSTPPEPRPPSVRKSGIYKDVSVFEKVDRGAVEVASTSHHLTFTDLISHLTSPCTTDVEKARSIFRWITVKNLNQMDFSETLRSDTPLGLLRGIKQGTESYHVLFKRLCSYAGLHCVVIKGWSKSAGYQPGVKFNDNRFRNSWNAVWVGGGWRFVQCNWGARHLVNAKDRQHHQQASQKSSSSDSLRYEYDDHYFLTDPTEFIYEFYPQSPEWQLLHRPITLEEFEELPFVRSLFFRYGLKFVSNAGQGNGGYYEIEGQGDSELSLRNPGCKAVVETDESGASTISLSSPPSISASLIFHYNLKLYDSEAETFDGISLKRFVMQSVSSSPTAPIVSFRVHAPSSGAFLLDIFANAVTPKEYLTGEPMKFKSVCKVKIICAYLSTVMVPLPNTASGEWGPAKATRLFGLIPITHPDPLIFAGREVVIQFRMSRALTDFMGTLHKNGSDEKKLSRTISTSLSRDVITFTIHFPEEGQYGLDIYTRENDDDSGPSQSGDNYNRGKQLLTHCCKYLINSSKKNA